MQVDNSLISRLEDLSCFTLSDAEKAGLAEDLQKIINGISRICDLNTDGVPAEAFYINANSFRDDKALPSFGRELILKNAPVKNEEFFIAPKTLE